MQLNSADSGNSPATKASPPLVSQLLHAKEEPWPPLKEQTVTGLGYVTRGTVAALTPWQWWEWEGAVGVLELRPHLY